MVDVSSKEKDFPNVGKIGVQKSVSIYDMSSVVYFIFKLYYKRQMTY